MNTNYHIFDDVDEHDLTWFQWRESIEGALWKSDDHSVMVLTPQLPSTHSVVAKDSDGRYLGSVVWNEYDRLAFIGFYFVREDLRSQGFGSILWNRALGRMPKDYTIALRAVPDMLGKYKIRGFPHLGPSVSQAILSWRQMSDFCLRKENLGNRTIKPIRDLNEEEKLKFYDFDRKVTGRNRSDFLRRFYFDLPFTAGHLLLNEAGEMIAMVGMTPTSLKDSHLFKIGPVYADSLEDALTVTKSLVELATERDAEAKILFHILSDSRGADEIQPLLHEMGVILKVTGISVFSREFHNPIDTKWVYMPNNNSGHYDA